ncbi:type II toxin-antitoxin system VapC family toxin [Amycolatopsis sp. WQ 127309]|uniref:type II toxin-antitoxin system VapC family toxin n=1 Tax=Amycolatopsis sp. WQ 127309 TaxID=2932773 RepID=UPI001FF49182|nr:type II toxin-antitoxin system VapC family toxin [Amycolatopsis sp. WQ 127309]UOZ07641.1 type II toxin-antitoxin system VapC family toxin [Amycolatopsis sp. WQ 127309]
MTIFYADPTALFAAYLADEPGHAELRELLLDGGHFVLTSELTRLELADAITAAKPGMTDLLHRFDEDSRTVLGVVPLNPRVFAAARRTVIGSPVSTLGAIHIAVAMHDTAELTGGAPVTFVTRDDRQAEAAKANGFEVL